MSPRSWLPIVVPVLLALTGCGTEPELARPLSPRAGPVLDLDRDVLAEFTIRFDRSGGAVVEMSTPDLRPVPPGALPGLVLLGRENAPQGDAVLATLDAYFGPTGGYCIPTDWGYEVQLTNDGDIIWNSPVAQLTQITPGTVTACNSDETGLALPGGGAAVADWTYGTALDPEGTATAHWGFDNAGVAAFTVQGRITIGDAPPTCGGLPPGDPGVCSGHGACVAPDFCDCDSGYGHDQGDATTCVAQGTPWRHTITIDGVNDFDPVNEAFATTTGGYTGYITWDDTNLYLGMDGPAVGAGDAGTWLLAYFGEGPKRTGIGAENGGQKPRLPLAASYYLRWRADGALTEMQVCEGTMSTFDAHWSPVREPWFEAGWTGSAAQAGSFAEISVPLVDIGGLDPRKVHLSMVDDTGTWAGVPGSSFTDGWGPDYTTFFAFDSGSPTPPVQTPTRSCFRCSGYVVPDAGFCIVPHFECTEVDGSDYYANFGYWSGADGPVEIPWNMDSNWLTNFLPPLLTFQPGDHDFVLRTLFPPHYVAWVINDQHARASSYNLDPACPYH